MPMKQIGLDWSDPNNRRIEALKYNSRSEFRRKKRTVYERCSYTELNNYFGKNKNNREHKIKCDYGLPDYYNFYKKIVNNPVSKNLYTSILKEYLKINHDIVSKKGEPFILPKETGEIVVRKLKKEIEIKKDGSIKNSFPVNWKATKKLWSENINAKKNKTLIRHTNEHTDGYYFLIVYQRRSAKFKGKSYYKMQINRQMQRGLSDPILKGQIDSFLLNEYKKN